MNEPPKKKRPVFTNPYEGLTPPTPYVRKPVMRRRRNVPTPEEIAQKEAEEAKKQAAIKAAAEEEDRKERARKEGKGKGRETSSFAQLSPEKIIEATMPKVSS